jgi:hypothetical protein
MSSFKVVLDACVLIPAPLRDTLLRAADAGLYRVQLTDDILEEMRRNLISQIGLSRDKAQRVATVIKKEFPEAFVTEHKLLIKAMPINAKDRHVLAAAVVTTSQVIVTNNLKDFPPDSLAPFHIEAQSPDDFLVHLFHLSTENMIRILAEQAKDLYKPSKSLPELLEILKLHAPTFVYLVQNTLSAHEDIYTWANSVK